MMRIIPEPVTFEWDKGNIDKNFKKHGIDNREAEEVFQNDPRFIFKDEKHSLSEERYMIWGITNKKKRLAVVFTLRNYKVRIISARAMHKKEEVRYEKI